MSRLVIVSGVCTSLMLGTALLAVAQDEHRDQQNQDRQNQERQNVERPAENRQEQQGQTQQEQNKNRQQQNQTNVERQNREPENTPRQGEMRPNDHQQNNSHEVNQGGKEQARPEDQARGGHPEATSRRIPDSDFRAHFGREHRFAPGRMEVYEGRPRFFYSGYTFELLDPWPSDWAYDQDDCYVDYADDGYWLYNDRYPGERVAVILVG